MGLFLMHATLSAPSHWVERWAHLIRPGGSALDIACGGGRHVRWLAQRGFAVTAVDRDRGAVETLRGLADIHVADIEGGPWPLPGRRFDAVIVTNYLWRAVLPAVLDSLADSGVLIYETFAAGNESVGKPSRPDFLLQPGELLRFGASLRVVAYEDGFLTSPDRFVQRMVAVREVATPAAPLPRYALAPVEAR